MKKNPPSRPRFFDLFKITGIGGYEQNKIPAQTVENHQTTFQKSDGGYQIWCFSRSPTHSTCNPSPLEVAQRPLRPSCFYSKTTWAVCRRTGHPATRLASARITTQAVPPAAASRILVIQFLSYNFACCCCYDLMR